MHVIQNIFKFNDVMIVLVKFESYLNTIIFYRLTKKYFLDFQI